VSPTPEERLAELVRDVERQRNAIQEYGSAGYVTMVERRRKDLEVTYARIRDHCWQHGLPIPPDLPPE
jgi:hypothetical protein